MSEKELCEGGSDIGSSYSKLSRTVAVQVEPYPGRWTVHIVIGSEAEIDEELLNWLQQAYDFAEKKGGKRKKSVKE